ncbi:MAG: hypothetical protein K2X77_11280, partial [Candidatus Obscuribacterales bacterium]|nr:hypothetical protein [Candidatus Obscuribacterales bacterium]
FRDLPPSASGRFKLSSAAKRLDARHLDPEAKYSASTSERRYGIIIDLGFAVFFDGLLKGRNA